MPRLQVLQPGDLLMMIRPGPRRWGGRAHVGRWGSLVVDHQVEDDQARAMQVGQRVAADALTLPPADACRAHFNQLKLGLPGRMRQEGC